MATADDQLESGGASLRPGGRARGSFVLSVGLGIGLLGIMLLFATSEHGEGLGRGVALSSAAFVRFVAPLGGILALVLAMSDSIARRHKVLLVKPLVAVALVLIVSAWLAFDGRFAPRGPLG